MMKDAIRTSIVLVAFAAAGFAQTPVGPNFQVNSYTPGYQVVASIGVEPDGDFVIVWTSEGQDGSGHGAFGQRFAASGAPRGSEFRINAYTTASQAWPDVAVGSAGDFVVVWASEQDGSLGSIQGKRFDASGSPVGGEFQINTYTTGAQAAPHVARAADGRFVVAWTSAGSDGDSFGISARRFDSSGNPVGDEFVVNTSTYGPQFVGDVASDVNGNFVVMWQYEFSGYPPQSFSDLYGQQFDAAGDPVGAEFSINVSERDNSPSVSASPSGAFVVAWTGTDPYGAGGYQSDVLATNVNGSVVNTYTRGNQFANVGSIAHDGGGNFIVTWASQGQDGDSFGIFGQRFDGNGGRIGAEFSVNTYTTGAQSGAVVGADAADNFIVAWYGWNGQGYEVFAQRFSALLPTADIAISISDSPDPVPPGADLVYTIIVTNNGPDPAHSVQVTLPTPTGLTFVSNTGACTTPFPCAFGTVLAAQTRTITATYRVPLGYGGPNPIVATVTATSTTADPNGANNAADALTTVSFSADLAVFKVGPATVAAGADVVYTISVANLGPSDAAGVQVGDPTPTGLTFVSNTGSCTTPFPCALGTVPSGQNRVITATFHVPGNYSGPNPIVNQATVSATTADPNGANNADDVSTTFIPANLEPVSIAVDAAGNSVFQPNETVTVAPGWRNAGTAVVANVTGAASSFTGPVGPTYAIADAAASYGTIAAGATASCGADCYGMTNATATRPALHWDTTFLEAVTPGTSTKTWTLHIGDSFADVPATSGFYGFIETILHKNVTGGCTATAYCPSASTTRDQMAVFVLVSREPAGYMPPACVAGSEAFSDVPASSPFCRWIEELARRGVVGGCGAGIYCPTAPATREQMAVFVLRTLDPALDPPACGTPVFADVPASSPFCRWIEELVRRGVVTGCGGGNYCPTAAVTREQMSVFLSVTFSLALYGL